MEPLRYDVNLSMLFTELDLDRRPVAAKAAGFDAVEFWWPFPAAVPSDREVDRFVRSIEDAGVSLVALNFFGGDMPAGERGVLSHPGRSAEFTDNVDVVAGIGGRLGCGRFNALYGNRLDGVAPEAQDDVAVEGLGHAGRQVERLGGTVLLEPLSGVPGYPLRTAADVLAVIDRATARDAGSPRLLFDIYHLVVNGDDPEAVLDRHASEIGHVQLADAPGRGEPGTGSIDFDHYLDRLRAVGYRGPIGLEYRPSGASADSFGWLNARG